MRKTFKVLALWLVAKGTLSLITGADLDVKMLTLIKDNWRENPVVSKNYGDLVWISLQALLVSGITLYKTVSCWKKLLCDNRSEEAVRTAEEEKIVEK